MKTSRTKFWKFERRVRLSSGSSKTTKEGGGSSWLLERSCEADLYSHLDSDDAGEGGKDENFRAQNYF